MTVRRGPLLWFVVVLSAVAVAACQLEPGPPPMELQSGRWESDDGQWWVELDLQEDLIELRLPPREKEDLCGSPDGDPRVVRQDFPAEDLSRLGSLPYWPCDQLGTSLRLRDTGDWRVLLDYPAGVERDPVELTFVE